MNRNQVMQYKPKEQIPSSATALEGSHHTKGTLKTHLKRHIGLTVNIDVTTCLRY